MSDERDELGELLHQKITDRLPALPTKRVIREYVDAAISTAIKAGYRKPRKVTTVEELDALGFHSVVLDEYGTPYVCERHRTDGTRNEWRQAGMNHLDDSEGILYHGPATVLHVGGAE